MGRKIAEWGLAAAVGATALVLGIKGCRIGESYELTVQQRDRLYKELFVSHEYATPGGSAVSICGLADQNENGAIEFVEQAAAWKRMGYWDRAYFESDDFNAPHSACFPIPTTTELKKARDWYRIHLGRDFPRLYPEELK